MVCLNTLGQDREFTDAEKKLALRTVRQYKERWEQVEQENLREDVLSTVARMQEDKEYRELHEALDAQALERQVEEHFLPKEGEDPVDEETRAVLAKRLRLSILTRQFYAKHEFPHHGKVGEATPKNTETHHEQQKH